MSSFGSQEFECQDRVAYLLRSASRLTPALFFNVVTNVCTRLALVARAIPAERLAQLVMAEAWTDAALFLIELELPLWRIRRLTRDGGEWMCSLSRHPSLPVDMDDAADGWHATMPIAILLSVVEAKRLATAAEREHAVRQVKTPGLYPICCDDFA